MHFIWSKSLESTQLFLYDFIKNQKPLKTPIVVATREQTSGIGSRANVWQQVACGLYFSCALHKNLIPKDLPLQSASIYFGMLFLELFRYACKDFLVCKDLWLKWPNDFYLGDKKVGGLLTQNTKEYLLFGIGLNLASQTTQALFNDKWSRNKEEVEVILYTIITEILHFLSFKSVEFDFEKDGEYQELKGYCQTFLQKNTSWNAVFRRYKQEFYKNDDFYAHINEDGKIMQVPLREAKLQDDGSISLHNKILYSLR